MATCMSQGRRKLEGCTAALKQFGSEETRHRSDQSTLTRTGDMALPSTSGAGRCGDGRGNLVIGNCSRCPGLRCRLKDHRTKRFETQVTGSPTPFIYFPILHSILISFADLFFYPTCLLFPYILTPGIVFKCSPGFHHAYLVLL